MGNHYAKSSLMDSRLYLNQGAGSFDNIWRDIHLSTYQTDAHGANWIDFDNDGDQDLMVVAGGKQGKGDLGDNNLLFMQDDGLLQEVAEANNLHRPLARGRFSAWFDLDHDGRLDVMQLNAKRNDKRGKNIAIRNYPDNYFIRFKARNTPWPDLYGGAQILTAPVAPADLTKKDREHVHTVSKLPAIHDSSAHMAEPLWSREEQFVSADFNNDGLMDLLVYGQPRTASEPCHIPSKLDNSIALVMPNGYMRKQDIDLSLQFEGSARLAMKRNGQGTVKLLRGAQASSETFTTIILSPGDSSLLGQPMSWPGTTGLHVGYLPDQDSWRLHSLGQWPKNYLLWLQPLNPDAPVQTSLARCEARSKSPTRLLIQGHDGYYNANRTWRVPGQMVLAGVQAGDFDNDGDVDLYLNRSSRTEDMVDIMLWNEGNRFRRSKIKSSVTEGTHGFHAFTIIPSRQSAVADYNNDGFLDIAQTPGVLHANKQRVIGSPTLLLRNEGNSNNWLQIQLQGSSSNRDGIGSRIELVAGNKSQVRIADGGFQGFSQNSKRIHFGLGDATEVERIRILWDSGTVQELENIQANQLIQVIEP